MSLDIDALIADPELEAELERLKRQRARAEGKASLPDTVLGAPSAMEELEELSRQLETELQSWRNANGVAMVGDVEPTSPTASGSPTAYAPNLEREELLLEEVPKEGFTEEEKARQEAAEELELLQSEFRYLDQQYPDNQLGADYAKATKNAEDRQPHPEPPPDLPKVEEVPYDDAALAEELEKLNRRLKGIEAKRNIESAIATKITPIPSQILKQTEYLKKLFASPPKNLIGLDKSLFT